MRRIFDRFDENSNAAIDAGEFGTVLENLGIASSPVEIEQMVKEADENGNGEIELSEFLALVRKSMLDSKIA